MIIKNRIAIFPTSNYEQYNDFSPVELFELFFDESAHENIVIETERKICEIKEINQCQRTFGIIFGPTSSEIKSFFGALLLSGYAKVPNRRMHWESSSDVRNEMLHQIFEEIGLIG